MSDGEPLLIDDERRHPNQYDDWENQIRPVVAEFVGVTVFVFVGTMVVQTNDTTSIGLAHGLMIALLIMGLGNISGGHFNPAVTLGVALNDGISLSLSVLYFCAQMIGGALGAAFTRAVLPSNVYHGAISINGGAHTLSPGVEPGWAILCEAILTFVLVFTVLMNALDKRNQDSVLTPLAIGFAVAVDIMGGGMTTGGSMNPARSFGPALAVSAFNTDVWKHHYVYWIGPAIGSLVAAGIYRFLFRR
ncbi:aquaporin-8-like [Mytilus californianus]|uniref:aquaporin-8-like n=1 Tax=Mytilus californianus TaxID=6549 RepID=UPI00224841E6|nr:aquaporin-8-like [Mytilus californianus]